MRPMAIFINILKLVNKQMISGKFLVVMHSNFTIIFIYIKGILCQYEKKSVNGGGNKKQLINFESPAARLNYEVWWNDEYEVYEVWWKWWLDLYHGAIRKELRKLFLGIGEQEQGGSLSIIY